MSKQLAFYTILAAVIIILTVIIFFIKIRVTVEYLRDGADDHLLLLVWLFGGLFKYEYEIDLDKSGIRLRKIKRNNLYNKKPLKDKNRLKFNDIYRKISSAVDFYKKNKDVICVIREYAKGRILITDFKLETVIGTGDAGSTGFLSGIAWGVIGIITSYLSNNFVGLKKNVKVVPNFDEAGFKIDLYCIFSIKIVHIIVMVFKMTRVIKLNKFALKGGV